MSDQILYKCALLLLALKISSINSKIPSCELKTNDGQKIFICNRNTFLCSGNCSSLQPVSTLIYESFQHVQPECKHTCQRHCRTSKPWSSWTSEPLIGNSTTIQVRRRYCKDNKIQYQCRKSTLKKVTIRVKKATNQKALPKNIKSHVRNTLQKNFHYFQKQTGESMELNCDNFAARIILRKYSKAAFRFIHNNRPMKIETDRMIFRQGILLVQSLESTDQGVYLCQIEYKPRHVETVALYSVTIAPNTLEVRVKMTKTLSLNCYSLSIGRLFSGSVRIWRDADGKSRSKPINASISGSDEFKNVKKSHAGEWMCHVEHKETNRIWQTSSYKVIIDPPPTALESIVDELNANKFKYGVIASGVFGFIFVMCASFLYKTDKARSSEDSQIELLKKQLKKIEGHGTDSLSGGSIISEHSGVMDACSSFINDDYIDDKNTENNPVDDKQYSSNQELRSLLSYSDSQARILQK